jgi:hypothetical protein
VKILDIVITGLLLGGLYALIALGLSLQDGVARVLNTSHFLLDNRREIRINSHRILHLRKGHVMQLQV